MDKMIKTYKNVIKLEGMELRLYTKERTVMQVWMNNAEYKTDLYEQEVLPRVMMDGAGITVAWDQDQ